MAAATKPEAPAEVAVDLETKTHWEPDMPKVDRHGREIVKVPSDNEAGFRYAYADEQEDSEASKPGWGQ